MALTSTISTLALNNKQEFNLHDPEPYLCIWMVEVPEPFPHSGLISQTPLLSIHSELVCREMSLCCGLKETLSSSGCCSGNEWGSRERGRAWDGGRERGKEGRQMGGDSPGLFSIRVLWWGKKSVRGTCVMRGWVRLWCLRGQLDVLQWQAISFSYCGVSSAAEWKRVYKSGKLAER